MNKLVVAGALAATAAFSTAAFAEPAELSACTKDGKTATVKIDATGGIKDGKTVAQLAQQAWTEAAAEQTADEISASPQDFVAHLMADLKAAIGDKDPATVLSDDAAFGIGGPPTITDGCKAPAAPAPAAK